MSIEIITYSRRGGSRGRDSKYSFKDQTAREPWVCGHQVNNTVNNVHLTIQPVTPPDVGVSGNPDLISYPSMVSTKQLAL